MFTLTQIYVETIILKHMYQSNMKLLQYHKLRVTWYQVGLWRRQDAVTLAPTSPPRRPLTGSVGVRYESV